MKKLPEVPFKAICIKNFNVQPGSDGRHSGWGCLEMFRIYEFNTKASETRIHTKVKSVSGLSKNGLGKYEAGYNIAIKKKHANSHVPYFWEHFVILK
jgi:hypothetical protein